MTTTTATAKARTRAKPASLYSLLTAAKRDGLSDDEAIDRAISQASPAVKARALRLYARGVLSQYERMNARAREDAILGGDETLPLGTTIDPISGTTFKTPDGREVTWGQATARDHELRANWQRTTAKTIMVDAARHERFAKLIRKHKVRCWDDLPEDVRLQNRQ